MLCATSVCNYCGSSYHNQITLHRVARFTPTHTCDVHGALRCLVRSADDFELLVCRNRFATSNGGHEPQRQNILQDLQSHPFAEPAPGEKRSVVHDEGRTPTEKRLRQGIYRPNAHRMQLCLLWIHRASRVACRFRWAVVIRLASRFHTCADVLTELSRHVAHSAHKVGEAQVAGSLWSIVY